MPFPIYSHGLFECPGINKININKIIVNPIIADIYIIYESKLQRKDFAMFFSPNTNINIFLISSFEESKGVSVNKLIQFLFDFVRMCSRYKIGEKKYNGK